LLRCFSVSPGGKKKKERSGTPRKNKQPVKNPPPNPPPPETPSEISLRFQTTMGQKNRPAWAGFSFRGTSKFCVLRFYWNNTKSKKHSSGRRGGERGVGLCCWLAFAPLHGKKCKNRLFLGGPIWGGAEGARGKGKGGTQIFLSGVVVPGSRGKQRFTRHVLRTGLGGPRGDFGGTRKIRGNTRAGTKRGAFFFCFKGVPGVFEPTGRGNWDVTRKNFFRPIPPGAGKAT